MSNRLLIVGASGRAAAASARRAGFDPFVIDLFADADTRRLCPVLRCDPADYPHGFIPLAKSAPTGPWMYTGGLENYPDVVAAISEGRELWGNGPGLLANIRDPFRLSATLATHGIPVPQVCPIGSPAPSGQKWLAKRFRSGGGRGIAEYAYGAEPAVAGDYIQEYIPGTACSALYVSMPWRVYFLGLATQLVGTPWLHAKQFEYAGSLAPHPTADALDFLRRLGGVVTQYGPKFGLFGIDLIRSASGFIPVEVNPRYVASVEAYELATGLASLTWHRDASTCLSDDDADRPWSEPVTFATSNVVGKAIYYAPQALTFPGSGPWDESLKHCTDVWRRPDFADIPDAGAAIEAGQPVLTILAEAATEAACEVELRRRATELDTLFGVPVEELR